LPITKGDCRAGTAAFWSFAQLFRLAATEELDVAAPELDVGLHPSHVDTVRTARIFVADFLENGAGYATHLGRPEVLERVFYRILGEPAPVPAPAVVSSPPTPFRERMEQPAHADLCTSSCPDCLRSYDNRLLHPVLDWRLGLDLAELARGRPLDTKRWLARGSELAGNLARAYRVLPLKMSTVGDLVSVQNTDNGRLAWFGHPLWPVSEQFFNERQANALVDARQVAGDDAQRAFDLYTLSRFPAEVFSWLAE
jgi:DEAD/DEAH box helicase domain-containing protein